MDLIKYSDDLIKFNQNHVPPGDSTGGQFASSDGSSSGGGDVLKGKDGKPQTFYHGTASGSPHEAREGGYFLTTSKNLAGVYGDKGKVLAVHLKMNKPLDLRDKKNLSGYQTGRKGKESITAYAKRTGHDGVIDPAGSYIALSKDQLVQKAQGADDLLKFNPHHVAAGSPEGGQFASADGATGEGGSGQSKNKDRKELEGMVDRLHEADGGFTYNPLSGEEAVKGYAVSPYPERSFAMDAKSITPDHIDEYVQKNLDQMTQPNHFIGAWHDPSTGKAFLDVSVRVDTPEEARKLALAHDQKAYFDFQTFKSVEVNANATSGGVVGKGDFSWRPSPLLRWSSPGPEA